MKHRSKYQIQLESFEWKKKRDKILDRDKKCQNCDSVVGLNVHHTFYLPKFHPAEYIDEMLIVLCQKCHKKEHEYQMKIESMLKFMRYKSLFSWEIYNRLFKNIECEETIEFNNVMIEFKNKYR